MSVNELLSVLIRHYHDKPDDFVLSIGHHAKPYPEQPTTMFNLPEFCAYCSITMGQVRDWARRQP